VNLIPEARAHAASVLEQRGPNHVFTHDEFTDLVMSTFRLHVQNATSDSQKQFLDAAIREMLERRQILHGGTGIPINFRLNEQSEEVIDALAVALLFCRIDGWSDDPSPTLWPQLQMTAHIRFIGMLTALRVGAPGARHV
jgi:hypothetical protein